MENAMTDTRSRLRTDSSGSGRFSRPSLDLSVSGDDVASMSEDGGALDALWRFEQAHQFLLSHQLATTHATFVDDLYAALETARDALEQQSVRVLAVLHDKDVRIQELENSIQCIPEKRDVGVQIRISPRRHDQATQSDATTEDDVVTTLRQAVSEQEEQIEVLLDELERIQQLLSEKETKIPTRKSMAIQTESVEYVSEQDQAVGMIEALQRQLDTVERNNQALRAALERPQQSQESGTVNTELDAMESQLHQAIQVMEMATQCRVISTLETNTSCTNLEHKLQQADLERSAMADEILSLRTMLVSSTGTQSRAPRTRNEVPATKCTNVTCMCVLGSVLRQVQALRMSTNARDAKVLRTELRHAWRGRKQTKGAIIAAQIAEEWMQWEAAHVEEITSLRRAHCEQTELQAARLTSLSDDLHRLKQKNIELETKLRVQGTQRAQPSDLEDRRSALSSDTALIDCDRRVLELEQSLQVKQDQLDIANRAVQAMSVGSDTRRQIAQLSTELEACKEKEIRRVHPTDTSQHAVVEFFRLEKECLRLNHRLKEKEEQVQQLELLCEQLEDTARQVHTKTQSTEVVQTIKDIIKTEPISKNPTLFAQHATIERYYLRLLEKRNEELCLEMTKARTRIVHLEREVDRIQTKSHDEVQDGHAAFLRELASRVEEYHLKAQEAFKAWQQQARGEKVGNHGSGVNQNGARSTLAMSTCDIILGHYEVLSLQLRLIQNAKISHPPHRTESVSRYWYLPEKIQVLEDHLLEAQTCINCGNRIPRKRVIKKTSVGTSTTACSTADATTQMSAQDCQRQCTSTGVQIDPEMVPFHVEESHHRQPSLPGTLPSSSVAMVNKSDSRLNEIQQQLDASLVRIDALTPHKEKLEQRLEEERRVNRRHVKEQETLRSQVAEMSKSNASLSTQVFQLKSADLAERDGKGNVDQMNQKLQVKEQENLELVRQLSEAKEKCLQIQTRCAEAGQRANELEAELKNSEERSVETRHRHFEEYMAKVNQSLATIERDKERLARENQELQGKLQQIERDAAIREAMGTRTCGTETDAALEMEHLLQLPEYQALETRVVMLQSELEAERRVCEELRIIRDTEQREKAQAIDAERSAMVMEKMELQRLIEEINSSHEQLQQEFMEMQAASAEAKKEADKRIQFLTSCVEECSRLVDAAGPNDDIVTSRDIYDTIVTLSKRVSATSANLTPRRSKSSQEKKLRAKAVVEATTVSETGNDNHGVQLHSQLQAEIWRVRVANLESALRAASLKTKTFEDMIEHLEVQMDGLKEEVKDRMTKESMLLSKQGQLKIELTSLKAQNGTLTSRLAEACGELKRSQDACKGAEGEVARLRSALQRKTELLSSQKIKCDTTQKALDQAAQRIAQLEAAGKNLTIAQIKLKDQTLQLQEFRQQNAVSRDANAELRVQVDKQKEQLTEFQSRIKALRLENGLLRDQLRDLKKTLRHEAETKFKCHASDTVAAAAAVLGDGKTPSAVTPSSAVDMLTSQVKTLKRRVLQKQDVILAYKTKLAELDAELTLQRTKLFDLSQTYRQYQQSQREKELSMVQGTTQLKDDLEHALANTTEQLDGLRASIYDACEVFIQCSPRKQSSSQSSSASRTWSEDVDDEPLQSADDPLLQEVREYADLSPADLVDLRLTSPKRTKSQRLDRKYALHTRRQHGLRVLGDLEHALEVTPHDCRHEICDVLAFLMKKR